jgi:hypothetical protein
MLSAGDLLAGSRVIHDVPVPGNLLNPGGESADGVVKLRPLSLAALSLISKAARDDAGLIPVLMLKESLLEPELGLDDIRRLHVGLVQFLLDRINEISGLGPSNGDADEAARSALGGTHLLLARHFGWTPEQVRQRTPGQVAGYLAGVRQLVEYDQAGTR